MIYFRTAAQSRTSLVLAPGRVTSGLRVRRTEGGARHEWSVDWGDNEGTRVCLDGLGGLGWVIGENGVGWMDPWTLDPDLCCKSMSKVVT